MGDRVLSGQVVGWLGDRTENGGWPPQCAPFLLHVLAAPNRRVTATLTLSCILVLCYGSVHFQLSLLEPETHDMPGVVASSQHAESLRIYPDPRMVLGPLYEGDSLFEAPTDDAQSC